MTEPTDQELDALLAEHWPAFATSGARPLQEMRAAMRDALAKWGTPPAVAGELVAWRYVPSNGWGEFVYTEDAKRAQFARDHGLDVQPVFTTSQPTQPQAGAVPLTPEQIKDEASHHGFIGSTEMLVKFVRGIEARLGIKGGQHGTE